MVELRPSRHPVICKFLADVRSMKLDIGIAKILRTIEGTLDGKLTPIRALRSEISILIWLAAGMSL